MEGQETHCAISEDKQENINRICMGKYTLVGYLGQGGEGRVYLARDEHLQRLVAVKCVREPEEERTEKDGQGRNQGSGEIEEGSAEWEGCQGNNDCRNQKSQGKEGEKMKREAEYLQRLGHPMLPVVYDLFADGSGIWYLVMEYIQGMTLHDYIERNGFVPERQARLWAGQLAGVLDYLHTRKPPVIYSDLKPDNIMVCPDGQLKLVDFGAALTRNFGAGRNMAAAVTPGYGAPEQWGVIREWQPGQGCAVRGYADERSDIYALGKVLYYMVTGADPAKPPYTALPAYEYQPVLGEGLEMIIRKCIRQEPGSRYQTAEEVQRDLGMGMGGKHRRRKNSFIRVIEKKVWLTQKHL